MQARLFGHDRKVEQLHWGGGTPTFISHLEMTDLMEKTRSHFDFVEEGEYSIEIDPRAVDNETITLLRQLGFNRLSMGIQDFDPRVQKAVNRIQSEAQTLAVIDSARNAGFSSVSVDLIYGLPYQSVASFAATVDKIIQMQPDRISVFNYAHLPEYFKPQRRIHIEDLPSPAEKLAILEDTISRLGQAGYIYIGMDHFARPENELAIAQREGTLYRNFQGYSTHADCDLVAMGITAIGMLADTYSQNVRTEAEYFDRIDAGQLPVFRGLRLSKDDRLRRTIISDLICHFHLRYTDIEARYEIDFRNYFTKEIEVLASMAEDGLLAMDSTGIDVSPVGRLLIRNICMVFDRYLSTQQGGYSKVI